MTLSRATFRYGDILDLPDDLTGFDGVMATAAVLAHFLTEEKQKAVLSSLMKVLRPGGVLLVANYDYRALMAVEPDDFSTQPSRCEDERGGFMHFQRRLWSGAPRERIHRNLYYRVGDDGTVGTIEVKYRAMFNDEITAVLQEDGASNVEWLNPEDTGFFKPVCLATKPTKAKRIADANGPAEPDQPSAQVAPQSGGDAGNEWQHWNFYAGTLPANEFEEAPDFKRSTVMRLQNEAGGEMIARRKQATLVMFSGGIDSVYTLTKLLRESSDDIIAHHIHFLNQENRHRAEAAACRNIVDHLQQTEREFIYTESAIDRRRFRVFGSDDMAVAFEVGIVSQSHLFDRGYIIDRWTAGICLEEELDEFGAEDVEKMEHLLNCTSASSYPNESPRFFQLAIIPKKDQMEYMGQQLVDLCWTCRAPVWQDDGAPRECGRCKTCELMNAIRSGRSTVIATKDEDAKLA